MRQVIIREQRLLKQPTKKRVAAYCRVSLEKESMLHSLSAQVSYYSDFIQNQRGWQYVGVYADDAISGTSNNRPEFLRLLADARQGKIDMIVTKSISRWARNTLTMLETVRELKSINVDVYFEKENIHSMSGDGELMLTILGSFAQEESLSVSENCKWRIRNQFKEGVPYHFSIIGYDLKKGKLEIVPKEAEIIRMIFNDFLSGMGKIAIIKKLNSLGLRTRNNKLWQEKAVGRILRNEKYAGDLFLQKFFSSNHLEKQKRKNTGQLPQYYVTDSHEPIIDRDTFERVQVELEERARIYNAGSVTGKPHSFAGKIICGKCGDNYRRRLTHTGEKYEKAVWICTTKNRLGKGACGSKQIPEDILMKITAEVLGINEFNENLFGQNIKMIKATNTNQLVFVFLNGQEGIKQWHNNSRRESWSEEKKQKQREMIKCRQQEQK